MKFKKLLSLAVAGAMVFAMAMPAFARGTTTDTSSSSSSSSTGEGGIGYESEVKTPTVKITVPASGAVVLNPYRLKFTVSGEEKDDAFYSAPVIATNESDCKVDVAVSAKATVAGDAKIVEAGEVTTSEPGDKNINVILTVNTVTASDATSVSATGGKTIKFDVANTDYGFGASTDEDSTPITLNPGNETANYLGFQLSGTINNNVSAVWAAADTVSVAIVLTFTPQPTQ